MELSKSIHSFVWFCFVLFILRVSCWLLIKKSEYSCSQFGIFDSLLEDRSICIAKFTGQLVAKMIRFSKHEIGFSSSWPCTQGRSSWYKDGECDDSFCEIHLVVFVPKPMLIGFQISIRLLNGSLALYCHFFTILRNHNFLLELKSLIYLSASFVCLFELNGRLFVTFYYIFRIDLRISLLELA